MTTVSVVPSTVLSTDYISDTLDMVTNMVDEAPDNLQALGFFAWFITWVTTLVSAISELFTKHHRRIENLEKKINTTTGVATSSQSTTSAAPSTSKPPTSSN